MYNSEIKSLKKKKTLNFIIQGSMLASTNILKLIRSKLVKTTDDNAMSYENALKRLEQNQNYQVFAYYGIDHANISVT